MQSVTSAYYFKLYLIEMIRSALSLIAWSFLAIGCAVSPEGQRASLDSATICCGSFSEFAISQPIPFDQQIEITSISPVFGFPSGRSHWVAFVIPDALQSRNLVIRTFGGSPVIANGLGGHTYFFPEITFLDATRVPVSTI